MLTILLNPSNPEPLYQQICTAIREDIAQGVLHPDEKLPSRRALSAHLQTSIVTVQTAYEQLAAEGYLYSRPRAGYFVDPDAPLLAHMPKETAFPSSQLAKTDPDDRIVFSTSGVDLEQFPFATWAKLSRQVLSSKQEKLLQSPPAMGLYELRVAIAAHLRAFRDIHAAPEQILVGAGTEYLLGILVQLLGASRRYAVEEPGYSKGKRILRSNGASVIDVPMDQNGLQLAALQQSGASVAHVTPSHQFPTGMIMPVRRRAELLAWASAQTDRYLIESALRRCGIENLFDAIFTCSEVGHGKDEPVIFRRAMEHFGAQRGSTVVFEDAIHAVETAKKDGFTVAAVFDESEKRQDEVRALADCYITSFEQLEQFWAMTAAD